MIHRPSRQHLALALRRYVACRITNDDLDDVEVDWRDRGAVAVKQMAWQLYDDTSQHYATGRRGVKREQRRCIARWIVFLQSNTEYLWPEYSFMQIQSRLLSWLTFGRSRRREERRWREFLDAGEFEAWPFLRNSDLKNAISKPRFFARNNV